MPGRVPRGFNHLDHLSRPPLGRSSHWLRIPTSGRKTPKRAILSHRQRWQRWQHVSTRSRSSRNRAFFVPGRSPGCGSTLHPFISRAVIRAEVFTSFCGSAGRGSTVRLWRPAKNSVRRVGFDIYDVVVINCDMVNKSPGGEDEPLAVHIPNLESPVDRIAHVESSNRVRGEPTSPADLSRSRAIRGHDPPTPLSVSHPDAPVRKTLRSNAKVFPIYLG